MHNLDFIFFLIEHTTVNRINFRSYLAASPNNIKRKKKRSLSEQKTLTYEIKKYYPRKQIA